MVQVPKPGAPTLNLLAPPGCEIWARIDIIFLHSATLFCSKQFLNLTWKGLKSWYRCSNFAIDLKANNLCTARRRDSNLTSSTTHMWQIQVTISHEQNLFNITNILSRNWLNWIFWDIVLNSPQVFIFDESLDCFKRYAISKHGNLVYSISLKHSKPHGYSHILRVKIYTVWFCIRKWIAKSSKNVYPCKEIG